jgi:anti-anti-sigma factor
MEIRELREDDVLVLAPDGSIASREETSALETKFGTSLKAGSRRLVFDCTAVGELTSAAIRVLLLSSRKLDRTEGRLVLCGMNAKLTKAFSISGFDRDFTVVTTREEALQRVREPVPPRPARKSSKASAPAPASAVEAPVSVSEKPSAAVSNVPNDTTAPAVAAAAPVAAAVAVVAPAEPSAPAEPVKTEAAKTESAETEPAETEAPAADGREAIADALIETLGARVAPVTRDASVHSLDAASLDALADGLLAALRVGQPDAGTARSRH